jgi:hypothetical protein
MIQRYDLFRMFREIAEDETLPQATNIRLSQAEINRLVKLRKRVGTTGAPASSGSASRREGK